MKKSKRKEKKRNFPFFGLFLVILVILVSAAVYFKFKKSPFYFLRRVNFVLVTGEREVAVFSLQDNEGLFLDLPGKSKVTATRGFGEYELGKVYALGQLERKGGELLKETVQENFSVPVFGYFYDPGSLDYSSLNSKKFFLRMFWQSLRGKIETDLSKCDLILLYLKAGSLKTVEVKTGDFANAEDFLKDKSLRGESCSIEVLNSTDHNGLAQQAAKLPERAGARIIRTADTPEEQKDCLLLVAKDMTDKYTELWLRLIFGCQVKESEEDGRADFTLVVGDSYWKKLNEKW